MEEAHNQRGKKQGQSTERQYFGVVRKLQPAKSHRTRKANAGGKRFRD